MAITLHQCLKCKNNQPEMLYISSLVSKCLVYCIEDIRLTGEEESCPNYVDKED